MLLSRLNRWNTNTGFRNELDRFFSDFFVDLAGKQSPGQLAAFPPLNVWEDGDNLFVEAELPGMTMDNVEVLIEDSDLSIKGSRTMEETEGVNVLRQERGKGTFTRTVRLPFAIDAEHVEATLRDGVLNIKLPKAAEARPRRIEVKAAD